MGKGGGDVNQSGMMEAMASAQAADKAYQLGEEQLQWTKDVWNKEQPLVDASTKAQMDLATQQTKSLTQMQMEAQQQWQDYMQTYQPLEQKFVGQVENWASPDAIAQARGEAMGSVAEQGTAGLNTAAETLRAYGVNPGSPRYASMYVSAQPMLGAAEAAAGTTAANNLRLQQMGLESGAINTGRGLVNATGTLTGAGTQAGAAGSGSASGAASTSQSNLSTGSTAMTNPAQWFNSGASNMAQYVNSVDGYNSAQADMMKAANAGMGGFGSALGTIGGALIGKIAKGGTVQRYAYGGGVMGYDDAGMVDSDPQMTPTQGGGETGIPSSPMPPAQAPPGGPTDATPGGGVPAYASPSNGQASDDVPALLTANEFVIPKDVATWTGHEYFAKQIDQARSAQQKFSQRGDIGGEPAPGIPQQPRFVSRPPHMGTTHGAIPGMG